MRELCQRIKQLKTEVNRDQNTLFGEILKRLPEAKNLKFHKETKEWQFDLDDITVWLRISGRVVNVFFKGGYVILHNQAYYWRLMEELEKLKLETNGDIQNNPS